MDPVSLFVGSFVSALVQFIKSKSHSKLEVSLIVMATCLLAAVGVNFIQEKGLFDQFVKILVSAGAFYAFVINNMK